MATTLAPPAASPAPATIYETPLPKRRNREARRWLLAALLILPALVPFATHYLVQLNGRVPTGFIQYDQPYYMANAREHFDDGAFRLTYGSAYTHEYGTPAIYFQPFTLVLGGLLKATGMDPAALYLLFGLVVALLFARVAIALYEELFGLHTRAHRAAMVAFMWGAGC